MSYIFTSLVGHQLFGVINAILCATDIKNKLYPLSGIKLYPTADMTNPKTGKITKGTAHEAQIIKKFCEENNYPPVEIVEIDRLNNNYAQLVSDVTSNGDKILFNIEGGMNYAVSQYISALMQNSKDSALIITDGPVCHTVNLNKSSLTESPDWDQTISIKELEPHQILDIQGTTYTIEPNDTNFVRYLKHWLKFLPATSLTNVSISGVTADVVWNSGGNHLSFLLEANNTGNPSNDKNRIKRRRTVAQWASSKTQEKNIYDAKCYVLCEIKADKESLIRESRGKAVPIKSAFGTCNGSSLLGSKQTVIRTMDPIFQNEIKRIFSSNLKSEFISEKKRTNVLVDSNTLITALGTDVSSTLTAISSHVTNCRVTHKEVSSVIILCSSDLDKKAFSVKDALKKQKAFSRVDIRIVGTDIKGRYIPFRLRLNDDATNVEVNITPGSKGQTAFLTCFAELNHLKIWSINKSEISLLSPVDEVYSYPVTSFDPISLLSVDDKQLKCSWISKEDRVVLSNILQEINTSESEYQLNDILNKNGLSIEKVENRTEHYVFSVSQETEPYKLGDWFERVTLVGMSALRGSRAYTNVEVMRSDLKGHIIEIDCLCSYGNMVLSVSCKAYYECTKENLLLKIKAPMDEAVAFAKSVGRFCLPVICVLNKFDLPSIKTIHQTGAKIAIIDLNDLADPQRLNMIFRELEEVYQSTDPEYLNAESY